MVWLFVVIFCRVINKVFFYLSIVALSRFFYVFLPRDQSL